MTERPSEEIQKQTEQLKTNMTELNAAIVQLSKSQEKLGKLLTESGNNFKDIGKAAKEAAEAIKKMQKAAEDNAKTISQSKKSLEENKKAVESLQQVYETLEKSHRVSKKQLTILSDDIAILTKNIAEQEKALEKSQTTFDFHAKTIDLLTSALDDLKESNKDFGPVMEDVTKGFNIMKDGLTLVKVGFQSVGGAIKATGFGLLVLVLQSVVEYFTKTTEGAAKFKGIVAAMSMVIKTVKDTVSNLLSGVGKSITDAFSHPAETAEKIWKSVIDNLLNRFKGVRVFLQGMFKGDFKEMGNGIIQMGTGVTGGIDKITSAVKTAKHGIEGFGKQVIKTYNDGVKASDEAAKKLEENNRKTLNGTEPGNGTKLGKTKDKKGEVRDKRLVGEPKSTGLEIKETRSLTLDDTDPKYPVNIKEKPVENNAPPIQTAIDDAHAQKKWQLEFELRKEQLRQQKEDAIKNAKERNQSILKVEEDYKDKQKALDKARQEAQHANQLTYLKSVQDLSKALGGVLGKNTVAAKVAFRAHQLAAAGQVVIDTKKSIMGIWSANSGMPFIGVAKAIAETAIVAATGASSLASIVKQKPGFAQGGQFVSDGRGALLSGYSRTDDTNAYLRSGEAVVVSEAMRNPWARNLVSAINVAHGGRDFSTSAYGNGFAVGGIFTDGGNANRYYSQPLNDAKDLANTLAYQMINNFPPIYVDVKDVNNQQNILAQTVNRVNL